MTAKKKVKAVQNDLAESAHKIWLAGLGALAVAGEEGSKLFESLVSRGEEIESKGKEHVDKAKETVTGVKTVAESYWTTFEQKLDERVTQVIHRLGVPTKAEIETLTKKVDDLTKSIEKLRKDEPKPKAAPKARTTRTAKAAAKPASKTTK